jgi:hypothetical protein
MFMRSHKRVILVKSALSAHTNVNFAAKATNLRRCAKHCSGGQLSQLRVQRANQQTQTIVQHGGVDADIWATDTLMLQNPALQQGVPRQRSRCTAHHDVELQTGRARFLQLLINLQTTHNSHDSHPFGMIAKSTFATENGKT